MKKIVCLFIGIMLIFTGCGADSYDNEQEKTAPKKVAACTGSLAEIWLLAGGELSYVTQDAYDEHLFEVGENVVCIGEMKSPSVEMMIAEGVDYAIMSAKLAEHTKLEDTLKKAGIETAYFSVESFDDYLEVLKEFTEITGRDDLYQQNGIAVKEAVDKAVERASGESKPTVLLLRASSQKVRAKGADTTAGAMLRDLNCINIADTDESLLDSLSLEAIIKDDPDFIFVTTMGADEEKALQNLNDTLMSSAAWTELTAVKNNRFYILPKALYHYKPNAKWGEAYENLAEILYGAEEN